MMHLGYGQAWLILACAKNSLIFASFSNLFLVFSAFALNAPVLSFCYSFYLIFIRFSPKLKHREQ